MSEPASPGAVARASEEWWRPTATLARFLEWSLGAMAALNLVLAFTDSAMPYVRIHLAWDAQAHERFTTSQRLIDHAFDGTPRVVIQLSSIVSFAVFVLLIVWTYRSATNAQALGRNGARLGPLWAIFGWFIPLASLVLPYLVIQDLWRSSDPDTSRGDGWRSLPGSTLVRAWWALRVVTWVAAIVVPGMALFGEWGTSPTETWLRVFHAVAVVTAVLAIFVVREITARQAAQQETDPAPTSRPAPRYAVAAATTGDGPGWYADPGGHFDHRYWDGTTWTEHVSTAGRPSTAPVTPPDWYPDPSGEFHWRYWTGHAWTEHVSRDGQLFIDPPPGES